jgi:hypothetical protein
MKKLMILIAVIMLTGCEAMILDLYGYHEQNIPLSFTTIDGAWRWVSSNIRYASDGGTDEWQTPEETYARRAGDCEDYTILMLYFIKDIAPDARMCVIQSNGASTYHAIISNGNVYMEPQVWRMYWERSTFSIKQTYSYAEALKWSFMRSVREFEIE